MRGHEKDCITRYANYHVENKRGALVILVEIWLAYDGTGKSALHECLGYDGEDVYHRHDTVVFWRQDARQEYGEAKRYPLVAKPLYTTPKIPCVAFCFNSDDIKSYLS